MPIVEGRTSTNVKRNASRLIVSISWGWETECEEENRPSTLTSLWKSSPSTTWTDSVTSRLFFAIESKSREDRTHVQCYYQCCVELVSLPSHRANSLLVTLFNKIRKTKPCARAHFPNLLLETWKRAYESCRTQREQSSTLSDTSFFYWHLATVKRWSEKLSHHGYFLFCV